MTRPRIKFRSLRVTPEFRDFVLGQLAPLPQLWSKSMFGGIGLYSGECFFGIVAADELFFKVDLSNRAAYEAAGSEPFRPVAARPVTMSYWRVPIEVLEDTGELAAWALAAIRAAGNAASKPKPKPKPKPKAKAKAKAKRKPARRRPKKRAKRPR
jgi:DNA transformation protein and related proteins